MKKTLAAVAFAAALLASVPSAAWAAPLKGNSTEEFVLHCAGSTVRVITTGTPAWEVDAQRELTGVKYFITSIDARFYEGDLATEPTGVDPVFAFAKEWGKRTGHEESVACTFSVGFTDEGQTFTGFFDVTATRQDKGN